MVGVNFRLQDSMGTANPLTSLTWFPHLKLRTVSASRGYEIPHAGHHSQVDTQCSGKGWVWSCHLVAEDRIGFNKVRKWLLSSLSRIQIRKTYSTFLVS